MNLKRILLISYYWPPSGGSGVQRWLYFANQLAEKGHDITVLTVDEKYAAFPSIDNSFNIHQNIKVHKTKSKDLIKLYSVIKSGNQQKAVPNGNVGGQKKSLFDKISIFVRSNFFIPDARIQWNKFVLNYIKSNLNIQQFDVLVTTGPPHSTHLIGIHLKKLHQIQWIADFRDPWEEIYYNNEFKKLSFAKKKDRILELSVLNSADLILTVGENMQKLLQAKTSRKVDFVYNGFDFQKINEQLKSCTQGEQKFNFVYTGSMGENYPYQQLIDLLLQIQGDFNIDFAGKIAPTIISEFEKTFSNRFKYHGILKHEESIEMLLSAKVLVLLLPIQKEAEIMVTGKLFEYLAVNKSIMCIGSQKSEAVSLIKKHAQSYFIEEETKISIQTFFEDVAMQYSIKNHQIESLSKSSQAEKLAEIISQL